MLRIEGLTKYYGPNRGVENLSLEVKDGEIFGFIGPNGAGKTTTIKCILNLIQKDHGSVYIDNEMVERVNKTIKNKVGYLPSEIHLYADLTVKEMLEYSASFYEGDLSRRIRYFVRRFDIDLTKKIGELSLGNLKKVGIVIALMHHPKFLILDEPTSGLDPLMQEVFFEVLEEEREEGTTIFFSSHVLSEVKRICDRVGIIKDGRLIGIEQMKTIREEDTVMITLISKEYKQLKLPIKNVVVKERTEDMLKFLYRGEIQDLISILSKIKVEKLLIEEPSLEEEFMRFYQ